MIMVIFILTLALLVRCKWGLISEIFFIIVEIWRACLLVQLGKHNPKVKISLTTVRRPTERSLE